MKKLILSFACLFMAISFSFAAKNVSKTLTLKEKYVTTVISKSALMLPQWTYTFYTTCGTTHTYKVEQPLTEQQIIDRMNSYNLSDCGYKPKEIEIREV